MDQEKPLPVNESPLYLCAPINAIVEGIYEEKIPMAQVKSHGDFGLGTFDHLDGEMVMLEGKTYQITSEGRVNKVDEEALTPFSCVTFYKPVRHAKSEREMSYAAFLEWIQQLLPSPNICYAIRIDGQFDYIKARSVPKQECYQACPPLVEVAERQPVFHFSDIEGTLAGFFTPVFMGSLNVPGLHLHFLSEDLKRGGHLLECRPRRVRAGVQCIYTLELALPRSLDYLSWDFRRDIYQDLSKAEK